MATPNPSTWKESYLYRDICTIVTPSSSTFMLFFKNNSEFLILLKILVNIIIMTEQKMDVFKKQNWETCREVKHIEQSYSAYGGFALGFEPQIPNSELLL